MKRNKVTVWGLIFPTFIALAASVAIGLADTGPRQKPASSTKINAPADTGPRQHANTLLQQVLTALGWK